LVWPLIVVAAGLAVPFLGSREFVKGFMRYKQKHPGDQSGVSGADMARAEPRMWLLPIGALIVGPILMIIGSAWFLWVLISSLFRKGG